MGIDNAEQLVKCFQAELDKEQARNWQSAEAKIETVGYQSALKWAIILAKELEEKENKK